MWIITKWLCAWCQGHQRGFLPGYVCLWTYAVVKRIADFINGRENLLPRLILLPLELMAELSLLLWKQFQSLRDGEPLPEIWKNDYLILSALLYLCFRRQSSAKYDAMKKCSSLEWSTGNMRSSSLVSRSVLHSNKIYWGSCGSGSRNPTDDFGSRVYSLVKKHLCYQQLV